MKFVGHTVAVLTVLSLPFAGCTPTSAQDAKLEPGVDLGPDYLPQVGDVWDVTDSLTQVQEFVVRRGGRQANPKRETVLFTVTYREEVLAVTSALVTRSRRHYVSGEYQRGAVRDDLTGTSVTLSRENGALELTSESGAVHSAIESMADDGIGRRFWPQRWISVGESRAIPQLEVPGLLQIDPSDVAHVMEAMCKLSAYDEGSARSAVESVIRANLTSLPPLRTLLRLEGVVDYRLDTRVSGVRRPRLLDEKIEQRLTYQGRGRALTHSDVEMTVSVEMNRTRVRSLLR